MRLPDVTDKVICSIADAGILPVLHPLCRGERPLGKYALSLERSSSMIGGEK